MVPARARRSRRRRHRRARLWHAQPRGLPVPPSEVPVHHPRESAYRQLNRPSCRSPPMRTEGGGFEQEDAPYVASRARSPSAPRSRGVGRRTAASHHSGDPERRDHEPDQANAAQHDLDHVHVALNRIDEGEDDFTWCRAASRGRCGSQLRRGAGAGDAGGARVRGRRGAAVVGHGQPLFQHRGVPHHELGLYFAITLPEGCPQASGEPWTGAEDAGLADGERVELYSSGSVLEELAALDLKSSCLRELLRSCRSTRSISCTGTGESGLDSSQGLREIFEVIRELVGRAG